MKTIISQRKDNYTFKFAAPTGTVSAEFKGGKSTQPDKIADHILMLGFQSKFYTLASFDQQSLSPGNSILLIRDMGLGDVLCVTPLARYLHSLGMLVDIQTEARYTCVFHGNPYIRNTFSLDSYVGTGEHSVVVDLRRVVENAEAFGRHQHRIKAFAEHLDISLGDEWLQTDYIPEEEELARAKAQIPDTFEGHKVIGFVWGSSCESRNWDHNRNVNMIARLTIEGYRVIVLSERALELPEGPTVLNLGGRQNIRQLAATMKCCDVVFTPDTGAFHLAGALDLPTVAYFSTMPVEERQAHSKLITLDNRKICPLFPCRKYDCMHHLRKDIAPCIDITQDSVLNAIKEILC